MAGLEDLYPQFAEYARRSMRNLGIGVQAMADNAKANNSAIRAGADATRKLMAGGDLDPADSQAVHNSPIGGFGADAGGPGAGGAFMGTYVGRGAANVPKRYLEFAEKAAARGMDNEAIRQKYGWFQDPSGDWKFEVSDHAARIVQGKDGTWKLIHPELRRQYPDMVDSLRIETIPATNALGQANETMGLYLRDTHTAKLNESLLANDPEDALRTLLHELQHGVQFREGFSPGTNPYSDAVRHKVDTELMPRWHALHEREAEMREGRRHWMNAFRGGSLEDFYKQHPDWTREYDQLLKQIREHPSYNEMTFQTYERALGEVEARDTMNRLRMTPEERKAFEPYALGRVPEGKTYTTIPMDDVWDVRDFERQRPRKAADVPEDPQTLIKRHLGLLPPE